MLKVENCVTPSPENWKIVIRGMRNAFKATDRMDSEICEDSEEEKEICYKDCPYVDHWEGEAPTAVPICNYSTYDDGPVFVLGPKDKDRLMDLCEQGSSDRKLLRQLPIIMDVNAPLYWHKQSDKYQIGTVTNSESTMHTITKYPFKLEDFSVDGISDKAVSFGDWKDSTNIFGEEITYQLAKPSAKDLMISIIDHLNVYREAYLKTKDKELWDSINKVLPQSYNQKRTWSLNYEVALNMTMQRYDHPLNEWHTLIQFFINELPYFDLILQAVGLTEELKKKGYQF